MTANNFTRALAKVLVHEGGYVNHPADPGGATNKGVTQKVFNLHRQAKGMAPRTVKEITPGEVEEIYKIRYWDVIKADELPEGIDYVVFDGAVNSGPVQAVKWLQRALGSYYEGKVDGMVGPSTLSATVSYPNHDELVSRILERRKVFLKALKTWGTFGTGWQRRLNGVLAVGQAWAVGQEGPDAQFVPNGNAKAPITDAKKAPSAGPGDAVAGGGATSAVCTQAVEQLQPLSSITFVAKAITAITVTGVVLTVGGLLYRRWAKRKEARLADALDMVAL